MRWIAPALLILVGVCGTAEAADKALQSEFEAVCLKTNGEMTGATGVARKRGYVDRESSAALGPKANTLQRQADGVFFIATIFEMTVPGEAGQPSQFVVACNLSSADGKTGSSETLSHMRSRPQP